MSNNRRIQKTASSSSSSSPHDAATAVPSCSPPSITMVHRQRLCAILHDGHASLIPPVRRRRSGADRNDQKCASSIASWMGDSARSMALRSVVDGPVDCDDDVVPDWSECICMSCGTLLYPPPPIIPPPIVPSSSSSSSSSSPPPSSAILPPPAAAAVPPHANGDVRLISMRRDGTRRRRSYRYGARQIHDRALALRRRGLGGGGSSLSNDISRKRALSRERTERLAYVHRIGDGRARNCLVTKCLFCGTITRRKGMDVKRRGGGGKGGVTCKAFAGRGTAAGGDDDAARRKAGDGRGTQRPPPEGGTTAVEANVASSSSSKRTIDESSDFIPLDNFDRVRTRELLTSTSHHQRPVDERQVVAGKRAQDEGVAFLSPLLMGTKKKKKKKKPETAKKSDLMDFLSKLND